MSTSTKTLEEFANREYRAGFVTDIEQETLPPGLNEDVVRAISAKKNEPEWLLEWRLKAYRHWLTMTEPRWPNVRYPPIDYQAISYYSAPKRRRTARRASTRSTRSSSRPTRSSASRSRSRSCSPASRSTRSSTASRSRRPSRRSWPSSASSSAPSPRRCSEHPELVQKYLGSVVPHTDNFFAALNSAVFTDGSFVYIPKGVRCPMELSTYFRINAAEHRPVRAHPDRRRGGRLRQLPRGLHRADARREPAARRGGRAGRPRRRQDQVLDGAELVPRRQGRQGRHLQLRHQARQVRRATAPRSPGPRSRPARRSPGSTRAASSRATTRSASSTRWR